MPSYYVHFSVVGRGTGNIVLVTDLPLTSQDLKASKKKIWKEAGLDNTSPEDIDITFIFELAKGQEREDVQAES